MARLAFLVVSGPDQIDRALPGLHMAERVKTQRGAEVQVLFFGPGVRLLASGDPRVKERVDALRAAGITPQACRGNAEMFSVVSEVEALDVQLSMAGQVVTGWAEQGYTVLTF